MLNCFFAVKYNCYVLLEKTSNFLFEAIGNFHFVVMVLIFYPFILGEWPVSILRNMSGFAPASSLSA